MQNKLPQFEANQVLSNVHLNQMIEYLEEQGRLTRNHLLGNGIVSGLDLKRESNTSLAIYEGVGVTSAGYLVVPDSANWQTDTKGRRFIGYNRRRKFEPKNLLFPHKGDFQTLAGNYSLFDGTASDIFQLIETSAPATTDVNVKNLTADDLNNHIVILFLQIQVKELKSCEGDDCIDLGKEWSYTVIPLLVSKTDADKILQNENKFSPVLTTGNAGSLVHPAWHLDDLLIQRPNLSEVSEDVSGAQLASIYRKTLAEVEARMTDDFCKKADDSLNRIFKDNLMVISEFRNKIRDILTTSSIKRPGYYQYAYDFACDFAAAYRELQDAIHEYSSFEIPETEVFPYHIRLGEVPATAGSSINSYKYPPSVYRHSFSTSRNIEKQRNAFHDTRSLVTRLENLTLNFTTELNEEDIRITPSNEHGNTFSEKSIPFYYGADGDKKPKGLGFWNSGWHRQGKLSRVMNYFDNANTTNRNAFRDGQDIAKDDPVHFPLSYNHEKQNFYRIEGYMASHYSEVFQDLSDYIHNYNLPFDLQLVALNKSTQMVIKEMRIRFNDLDSMYNVMCEEVRCLLTTELNYFKNIRLTRFPVRKEPPLKGIAALEEIEFKEEEPLTLATRPAAQPLFFKTMRVKGEKIFGGKMNVETLNLGVKDSAADIGFKLGGKVGTVDLGNIIGNLGGKLFLIPTLASPYVLKIISVIEKLIETLSERFDDFNVQSYQSTLSVLHNETKSFILFAKPQSAGTLLEENNVDREELLGYLERILYECDFEKISALDEERDRREEQLGFNNYLKQFIDLHPGLEHKAGVWKNGTFVVVFNRSGEVVADFCLPYRCCNGMATTQFVLGVVQTLWFDGQVLDKNGTPVTAAIVILNNETLPVDQNGRFRKAISPNTFIVLKVTADGFEPREISLTSGTDSITQSITLLTKAQEPKVTLKLKVTDSSGRAIPDAEAKLGEDSVKTNNNGEISIQIKANATVTLAISKQGFLPKTDTIITQAAPLALEYKLTKIIKLTGTIEFSQQPVLNATVFIDDKPIPVTQNKFAADLEDNKTYKVTVAAANLQTFIREVKTEFSDIDLKAVMEKIKTVSVRVGVYITSGARHVTAVSHAETGGRIMTHRTVTAAGDPDERRVLVARGDRARVVVSGTAATTGTPPPPPPEKFNLMDNSNASSFIDDKGQAFNNNLRVFESQEIISIHRLVVKDIASAMDFASALVVGDSDVLVLIKSVRGKQPEGQFSFLIGSEGGTAGAQSIARFNEVMASTFNLPAGQSLAQGKTIDIRIFTASDAREFMTLMNKNHIAFVPKNL